MKGIGGIHHCLRISAGGYSDSDSLLARACAVYQPGYAKSTVIDLVAHMNACGSEGHICRFFQGR